MSRLAQSSVRICLNASTGRKQARFRPCRCHQVASNRIMTAPAMPEPPPPSLSHENSESRHATGRMRSSRLRRVGCGLLVPLWFMLLMMPCALIYLAVNGEIRVWHDSVPEPHSQPRLLISLISEMESRGLRFQSSTLFDPDAGNLSTCVETNVRFVLWESQGGNQDVTYCECYARLDEASAWASDRTYGSSCKLTE